MNRRTFVTGVAAAAVIAPAVLAVAPVVPAAAQGFDIDIAHAEENLRALGLPVVSITVGPDQFDLPATLEAGNYLFELFGVAPHVAYLNIMVPPAGLDDATALEQARDAATMDLVRYDWYYRGGGNTFEDGVPTVWAMTLEPGEYVWAASYYGIGGAGEEEMILMPLTVTEASATPAVAASPAASPMLDLPPGEVVLEMTDDLEYIVSPDPLPAGPHLWEVVNTGEMHAHHVVMWRTPEGTTREALIAEYNGLLAGTPPAGDGLVAQLQYVGYAALQSGGASTLYEFDLSAGTYAVICFIIDPDSGRPHFADGMITVFTVAE